MTDSVTLSLAGGNATPLSNTNPVTPPPNVDVPQVSNLSRARAAQGDASLSAETQAAIAEGATPPIVIASPETAVAAPETSRGEAASVSLSTQAQASLSNNASTSSPAPTASTSKD